MDFSIIPIDSYPYSYVCNIFKYLDIYAVYNEWPVWMAVPMQEKKSPLKKSYEKT